MEDQVPGVGPTVLSTTPADHDAAVTLDVNNEAVIVLSENVHPCTVNDTTVRVHEYQRGDRNVFQPAPNGNASGFVTPTGSGVDDATPGDPYTWGATNPGVITLAQPQKVLADIVLVQSFAGTEIRIRPQAGTWPDDALIVVELTFGLEDFAGLALAPYRFSFTTENEVMQSGVRAMTFEGETPVDDGGTTADVNTARSPSKAQGYMLFAGDGDNGTILVQPSKPETAASGCNLDRQANDGTPDDFDPAGDVLLDTGLVNTCANSTDGSTAVVWEFNSFRLRSGRTLRIIGSNPAIILCLGDILVESGARILVRGDGASGAPQSRGANGQAGAQTGNIPNPAVGGTGVAGGGNGGTGRNGKPSYGGDGVAGYGSPQVGIAGGTGGGQGNTSATWMGYSNAGASGSGGGGGHSEKGANGQANANTYTPMDQTARGAGGDVYPTTPNAAKLRVPHAGSGGGAGGYTEYSGSPGYYYYTTTGGAGGAGGGFLDLTANGDILIFGVVDAAGGGGGNGGMGYGTSYWASGGGGGGSGGGVRMLTPNNINLSGGTVTTAGGNGGSGAATQLFGGPANPGGAGGPGNLCLEDGDSLVTGMATATLVPAEGAPGFYRGVFDAARFQSGGLTPQVLTEILFMGPTNPSYQAPVVADFPVTLTGPGAGSGAGIPSVASKGLGSTGILIEARGFPILPDGTPDLTAATAFYTVGYFKDSGQENAPTWVQGAFPADIGPRAADNGGDGIANLDGRSFLQVRITFYLPSTVGPFDPGPFLNHWNLRFTSDQ
jgi:hypothetical protein